MSTHPNSTILHRGWLVSLSAFVILADVAIGALAPGTAEARPPRPQTITCTITTYYSDPRKTQEVGTLSACAGAKPILTGRETPYYRRTTTQATIPGPENPPPADKPPCEFLQGGCSPLPVR